MNPEIHYEAYKSLSDEGLRLALSHLKVEAKTLEDRLNYIRLGQTTIMNLLNQRQEEGDAEA